MIDKERFHNTLALSLGYERIINDKRITIDVDDSDGSWVTLRILGCSEVVKLKASSEAYSAIYENIPAMKDEINYIADAVHHAYRKTIKPF